MPIPKTAWVLAVVLTALTVARADRIFLTDGRVLTGQATVGPTEVRIDTAYGTIRFPRHMVERVEAVDTPQQQLSQRLTENDRNDPNALYVVARWADAQGLAEEAQQLYREVLALDSHHAQAREALGYLRVEGQWVELETGLALLRARLAGGALSEADPTVEPWLAELTRLARQPSQRLAVRELRALWLVRQGKLPAAGAALAELAREAQGLPAFRLATLAGIITENSDGMYVLTEPYPPQASLLGAEPGRAYPPGPAPLTEPIVLQAALRDRARGVLEQARAHIGAGQAVERTDRPGADEAYRQALASLDRADALVPEIARSYRIEVIRRQVALLRRDVEAQAALFDAEMATLGKQELSPQAYTYKLGRMVRYLSTARETLDRILGLSGPFTRELVLEIRWAELDRQRIDAMLTTLRQELHELR